MSKLRQDIFCLGHEAFGVTIVKSSHISNQNWKLQPYLEREKIRSQTHMQVVMLEIVWSINVHTERERCALKRTLVAQIV